ncbi:M24 family metallopeptidase [Oricola cellulosilytica]|uniref:Aminopeptidase P family protein n=1 Tax=Oricola cellulosilytica TaxID=1429082 RepID=A0A4R0PE47_9HYPH|nr:Xaa-Pro peptidase family protein [Oricola cellulosilytica]TCD14465.1 aminopeptidase P family protein [Oricola cellulosilytica]
MTTPDFPQVEYEERLERVQAAMHAARVDALFFTSEAEVHYFSGFRTLFWLSPTRPWFLIVPKRGKPIAVIPEIGAALMHETWIDDIRTWNSPDPVDDGNSLLASLLTGYPRVGAMMGRETSLRMPLADFEALRRRLSACEFVDVTAMVQKLRMVKSPDEIAKIKSICAIASRSFEAAPALFSAGQSLKEVFRSFRISLLENGADDVPYLVGGAGQGGYSGVISPPTERPLMDGDILMLDTGATLGGYYCDFDRNFAIGHAPVASRKAYSTLSRATDAALAIARPGVRCSELFRVMAGEIGAGGSDTAGVGRFGHGLGMQLTEPPSLAPFDDTILAAGMVITLEPGIEVAEGRMMVQEENIVIRDGAPELLSWRAPAELPVIGAAS